MIALTDLADSEYCNLRLINNDCVETFTSLISKSSICTLTSTDCRFYSESFEGQIEAVG